MIKKLGISKKGYRIALIVTSIVCLSIMNISGQQLKSLKYLYSISGEKTLSGMHNDQKENYGSAYHTNKIAEITGKSPAVWASDFSFDHRIDYRRRITEEAERQWNNGAIVSLSWHVCPPTVSEPCDWWRDIGGYLTDSEWEELITDGTYLNKVWKERMDDVVGYLQYLQSKGVEVLWRPFHEMNKPADKSFWWTGRKGPRGSQELYRQMRDYFEKEKGLTNLVWLWNCQDLAKDFEDYNPGGDYWDMLTIDIYGPGYGDDWYNYVKSIAGGKPIGIGECWTLPSPGKMESQPDYTYFLGWANHLFQHTSNEDIKKTYNSPRVVTRDEMPDWGSVVPDGDNLAHKKPVYVSSIEGNVFKGASAVDGLKSTRWASLESDPQWIYVDLEKQYNIKQIKIYWEAAYGKSYEIQVSDDAKTWNTIHTNTNSDGGLDEIGKLNGTGRYLRVLGTERGTQWGYSIWELEVYGTEIGASQPPTIKLTAPANGASYFAPATINMTADASDADGTITKVDFYNGTTLLGSDTISPYSYSWNGLTAGSYSLKAVATDNEKLTATSPDILVTVKKETLTNLALSKPTKVSSIEATSLKGDYAVDGDTSTRWASAESDPQWIQVDLEALYSIDRVKVIWETAYGKDYQIQTSADATNWATIKTVTDNTVLENDHKNLSATARYIRIYGTKRGTQWGYSIYELEVYGKSGLLDKKNMSTGAENEALSIKSYPNPYTDKITIKIDLKTEGHTAIELVNVMGVNQLQLHSGYLNKGSHAFTITKKLPSGVYFCSVTQNGKKISTTIIKK